MASSIMALSLSCAIIILSFLTVSSNPINNVVNGVYEDVGTVYVEQRSITWKTDCFKQSTGRLIFQPFESPDQPARFVVAVTARYPHGRRCSDTYKFRLEDENVGGGIVYSANIESTFQLNIRDEAEKQKVIAKGIKIFVYRAGNGYDADNEFSGQQMETTPWE